MERKGYGHTVIVDRLGILSKTLESKLDRLDVEIAFDPALLGSPWEYCGRRFL